MPNTPHAGDPVSALRDPYTLIVRDQLIHSGPDCNGVERTKLSSRFRHTAIETITGNPSLFQGAIASLYNFVGGNDLIKLTVTGPTMCQQSCWPV